MRIRKWLVYLLYGIPGIFLALWMERLYGTFRPYWLFPAQIGIAGISVCVSAYICGRKRWKRTFWLGNTLNYFSSWIGLAWMDGSDSLFGLAIFGSLAPCSFYREVLTVLFGISLYVQWFAYAYGQTIREKSDRDY